MTSVLCLGPAARAAGPRLFPALLAALLLAGASPARAGGFGHDVSRRLGVAMISPEVPLGVRYLFERRVGLELGLGLTARERAHGDAHLDAGILIALAPGDRVNFYLRPGARFASMHPAGAPETTVELNLGFDFEVFVAPDFSVTASQGVALDFVSAGAISSSPSEDHREFNLFGGGWPHLGFVYYLPR